MRDRYDIVYSPYAWKGGDDTGQNHAVDNEKDSSKTLCGKPVLMWEGTGLGLEEVTCLICRGILEKRGCYEITKERKT